MVMKVMKPNCKNFRRCGRRARSIHAKFCEPCFKINAARTGRKSSGNTGAKGSIGNVGNSQAQGKSGNAGNLQGNPDNAGNLQGNPDNAGNRQAQGKSGNAGNPQARGKSGNAGNVKIGAVKKRAGKRSGVRRSAKRALVIKKKWLDLILDGRKTWEIRGSSTAKRGWVHLAESKAGGKLVGRAKLVASFPLSRSSFMKNYSKHRVSSLNTVPYETPHAWVFADAEKFQRPFLYEHKQGAVVWVDV